MPLARIGGRVLLFVHIPKTGGTSVEAYLRAKGAVALHGQGAGWSRLPLQHLHREAWTEVAPAGFWDAGFAILRDPKARLISEFRMRAEPLSPKLRPLGWLRAARNRLEGRPTYGLRLENRIEFLDFDAWVPRVFEATRRDPLHRSNHLRPQADFVDPALTLFRFEDGLDPVFRWIDAIAGTPPAPGPFHERRSEPIPVACAPGTDRAIRDFYAEDYALIARTWAGAPE